MKTMISARVAKQRINRALRPYLHSLKTICWRYHVIDQRRNLLSYYDVDLEAFGQELGVIKLSETVLHKSNELPITGTLLTKAPPRYTANRFGYGSRGKAFRGIDQYVIEDLRKLLVPIRRTMHRPATEETS
jgi:hypothetical protein